MNRKFKADLIKENKKLIDENEKLKDRCEQLEKHKSNAVHIITKERQLIKEILDSYWNTLSDGDEPSNENVEKWSLIAEKFGSHFGQEV
ncbi:MAG: hypothetical protein ACM3O3_05105 [Syntrophothermus sp.]